jgi:hypothetical protein
LQTQRRGWDSNPRGRVAAAGGVYAQRVSSVPLGSGGARPCSASRVARRWSSRQPESDRPAGCPRSMRSPVDASRSPPSGAGRQRTTRGRVCHSGEIWRSRSRPGCGSGSSCRRQQRGSCRPGTGPWSARRRHRSQSRVKLGRRERRSGPGGRQTSTGRRRTARRPARRRSGISWACTGTHRSTLARRRLGSRRRPRTCHRRHTPPRPLARRPLAYSVEGRRRSSASPRIEVAAIPCRDRVQVAPLSTLL